MTPPSTSAEPPLYDLKTRRVAYLANKAIYGSPEAIYKAFQAAGLGECLYLVTENEVHWITIKISEKLTRAARLFTAVEWVALKKEASKRQSGQPPQQPAPVLPKLKREKHTENPNQGKLF